VAINSDPEQDLELSAAFKSDPEQNPIAGGVQLGSRTGSDLTVAFNSDPEQDPI
jgi:hypothetical protein